MKKSLQTFLFASCLLLFSCHKSDVLSTDSTDNDLTSNLRGESVGGSSGGVTFRCESCMMTYPDNSKLPRSGQVFNENEVLVATDPGSTTCGSSPDYIKVWYSDEHPICLGVRQVIVKDKTGTTVTNREIEPTTQSPAMVTNPSLGALDQDGDFSGNDVATDGGRPLWPALFITDITTGLTKRDGDWQQGGTAITPDIIYGMWKTAVRTVDKTKTPALVTITVDADPNKSNGWNLAGGEAPPAGTTTDKYGALVKWDVNKLIKDKKLEPGHIYRLQFMVHDGDQNKTGGDVGESCTTLYISK